MALRAILALWVPGFGPLRAQTLGFGPKPSALANFRPKWPFWPCGYQVLWLSAPKPGMWSKPSVLWAKSGPKGPFGPFWPHGNQVFGTFGAKTWEMAENLRFSAILSPRAPGFGPLGAKTWELAKTEVLGQMALRAILICGSQVFGAFGPKTWE